MISTIGGLFDLNHFDQSSRANDVIVIRHRDGSLHSTPFNVRFGRARIWNSVNKVVQIEVNGVMTKAVMKIGKGGEAFWLHPTYQRPSHAHEQKLQSKIKAHVQKYLDNHESIINKNGSVNITNNIATNPNNQEHSFQQQQESTEAENENNTQCRKTPLYAPYEEQEKELHNSDQKANKETEGQETEETVANYTKQECNNDKIKKSSGNRNSIYENEHHKEANIPTITSKNDVLLAEQVLKAAAKAEKRLSKLHVVNELLEWGVEHEDTLKSSGSSNYYNINNIVSTNHDEEVKVNEEYQEGLSDKSQREEKTFGEAHTEITPSSLSSTQLPAQSVNLNDNEKKNNQEHLPTAQNENDCVRNDDSNRKIESNVNEESNAATNFIDNNESEGNGSVVGDDNDDEDDLYLLDPIDISDYTSSELRNREMLEPVIVDGNYTNKESHIEITKNNEPRHDVEHEKGKENNSNKQKNESHQLLQKEQEHLLEEEPTHYKELNYLEDDDEVNELERQQMEEYEAYAEADQLPNWSFSSSVTSGLSVKDDSLLEPETSFTSENGMVQDQTSALRKHDPHRNQYAMNNNATNKNNNIRSHVGRNTEGYEPAYAENTTLEEHNTPYFTRSLLPTVTDLLKLNLKEGVNEVKYVTRKSYDTPLITVSCNIYLWNYNDKIIVSDIDGTITKSDLWGHFYSMLGKGGEWTHPGICALYTKIVNNGYKILYLSARSVTQIYQTKKYLWTLEQEKAKLPLGPVLTAPLRIFTAITKEVSKQSHVFKIACLTSVIDAYPPHSKPFFAGFGNRYGDVVSYSAVHIPIYRIFIIDPSSVLHVCRVKQTYRNLTHLVDMTFPPLKSLSVLSTTSSWQLIPATYKDTNYNQAHTETSMPGLKSVEHLQNVKKTVHHTLEQHEEEKSSQLSDLQSNSINSYSVDEYSDDGKSFMDFNDNNDDETGSVSSVEHNNKNATEGKGVAHQHAENHSMAFDLTNNNTLIDNVNGEECTLCTINEKNSQCGLNIAKSGEDNAVAVAAAAAASDGNRNRNINNGATQNNHCNEKKDETSGRQHDLISKHDKSNSATSLESVNKTSVPRLLALDNQNTRKEEPSPWHDQAISVNVSHFNQNAKSKHDFPLLVDNSHFNDDIHVDPEFASFQFWSVNPADLIEPVHVKTKVQTTAATAVTTNSSNIKPASQVQKQSSTNESKINATDAHSVELPVTANLTDTSTVVVNSSAGNNDKTSEEKNANTLSEKLLVTSPRQYTQSKKTVGIVGENTNSSNYGNSSNAKSAKEHTIVNNSSNAQKLGNTSKQDSLEIKPHGDTAKKSSRFFSFARVWSQNSSSSSKTIPRDSETEQSLITPELQEKRYQHPDLATYLRPNTTTLQKNENVSDSVTDNKTIINNNNNSADIVKQNSNNEDDRKDSTSGVNTPKTPILKPEEKSVEEVTPIKRTNDNVSLSPTTSMLSSLVFWKKNVAVPGNVNQNIKSETVDESTNLNINNDNGSINTNSNTNDHTIEKEIDEKGTKLN